MNTIDLEAAGRRGIFVANCPGKNAVAVAELTLGLMLALDRGIAEASNSLHEGTWCKKQLTRARAEGSASRLGRLRGHGAGGGRPRRRPRHARGGLDAAIASGPRGRFRRRGLPHPRRLLSESDVVSVHCPNRPETRGLIADRELNLTRGAPSSTPPVVASSTTRRSRVTFARDDSRRASTCSLASPGAAMRSSSPRCAARRGPCSRRISARRPSRRSRRRRRGCPHHLGLRDPRRGAQRGERRGAPPWAITGSSCATRTA